mmetsp:Transcript_11397/g.11426  ORF Transcript_11397/g.11426 Transcript_11397/m.11426 type:complete len:294 (+) Transcript_11397:227-1108(+)|eukprot:CAMPEP_0182420834 /NCGR_PEP_ID=MMETSP1167-20130531/5922_1 /TAXON_ID=2988 /ORGANISM="Mallomonas Sp, Strain CCMP3275" /LENGTH=293 /DNA_ID=CAMNT_0024597327 /DNA_START=186 /DNA_END=1067 /DNA_ORIENTATION=-
MEVTDNETDISQSIVQEYETGGFSFDLYARNQLLLKSLGGDASRLPQALKTGTTIVGVIYKDGVILGADTRATGGDQVMDKNCYKIHYLAPNMYCCGAGTAADTEKTTEMIASNLELLRLSTGTQSRVITGVTLLKRLLFKYQGHIGAALIVGGVDVTGIHLHNIAPHGSTSASPYTVMGSGSLAAMAILETRYVEDMDEATAMTLVKDAIRAGIFNDLASGSNVDLTIIRKGGEVVRHRTYENSAGDVADYKAKYTKPISKTIPAGATFVIESSFKPHKGAPKPAETSIMDI